LRQQKWDLLKGTLNGNRYWIDEKNTVQIEAGVMKRILYKLKLE